jgi:hypothetical protein
VLSAMEASVSETQIHHVEVSYRGLGCALARAVAVSVSTVRLKLLNLSAALCGSV